MADGRRCGWATKDNILKFVCKTAFNFLSTAVGVFLLWFVFYRPYKIHPSVDSAKLAAFHLESTAAKVLRYDLALNVSFFNDHRINGIRFNHLTAALYYNGTKLGPSDNTLQSFNQPPRHSHTVNPALRGQATNVSTAVVEQFKRELAAGQFNVVVTVKRTLTYKFWPKCAVYFYEYDCPLQFAPPPSNGPPATAGDFKCSSHRML